MSGIDDFNNLIAERFRGLQEIQTAWVTAKNINWKDRIMDGTGLVDDLDYFDIQLGLGSEARKPKDGSRCIIGIISNQPGDSFLIHADEIEEMELNIGKSLLHIKGSGFILKQDSESLKKVLNDMIDELNKIIVIQGTTINVAAMNVIKQRINKILID